MFVVVSEVVASVPVSPSRTETTQLPLVWLAIALVPSFAYFRTPGYWHCDHFDGFPVQHYVAAQLTIAFDTAVALVAYLTTDRRAA